MSTRGVSIVLEGDLLERLERAARRKGTSLRDEVQRLVGAASAFVELADGGRPQRPDLSSDEAAAYLGYTRDRYRNPGKAFRDLVRRCDIPRSYAGRRLRFRRADLDRFVDARVWRHP